MSLAGSWWIIHTVRHPKVPFFQEQIELLEARADIAEPGGTLVIGDSIVARNFFPKLCGRTAFNAGVSWSTSHDWQGNAQDLIRRARPAVVVLALGNNDSRSDWRDDYARLARLATIAVTPKQADKAAFIAARLPTVPVPASTYDGTHLTTKGAQEWVRRVNALCTQKGLMPQRT